jgi:hypothetical protein
MLYFDLPVCGCNVAFLFQENGQERKSILWSVKLFCGLPLKMDFGFSSYYGGELVIKNNQ